jgi:hypothetical protein
MRSVVAQLSTLSFVSLCVASSVIAIFFIPTVIALSFDLVGLSSEAPLSNFVGWSLLLSAAVGLASAASSDWIARPNGRCRTPRGSLRQDHRS